MGLVTGGGFTRQIGMLCSSRLDCTRFECGPEWKPRIQSTQCPIHRFLDPSVTRSGLPTDGMETILADFAAAYAKRAGYQLAKTLSPETSNDMLREICGGFNALKDAKLAIKRRLQTSTRDTRCALSNAEATAWADVYLAYYRTLGELLAVRDGSATNGKVSSVARSRTSLAIRCAADPSLVETAVVETGVRCLGFDAVVPSARIR